MSPFTVPSRPWRGTGVLCSLLPVFLLLILILFAPHWQAQAQALAQPQSQAPDARAAAPDDQPLRIYLADGTVVQGELSMDTVTINTRYGPLAVPVSQIINFTPGLNSRSDLAQQLDELLQEARSEDPAVFGSALRELETLGPRIVPVIQDRLGEVENQEARVRLQELVDRLIELRQEDDLLLDGDQLPSEHLIEGDRLVTTAFTIVGEINPRDFSIASKYGKLTVTLNDIRHVQRETGQAQTTNKTVTVQGMHMVQRQMASAGVRLQRGDRVSIEASGTINYTPRGSNAMVTPAGAANYGTYRPGIPVGMLLARVGPSGDFIKVGNSQQFVADRNGTLQLGWACADNYATRSYNWAGEYKVKVRATRPPG